MENIHQLLEIINAHESALEASSQSSQDDLTPVLNAVLDPLVSMCESSAEALKADAPSRVDEVTRIHPTAYRVYLVNCLAYMINALAHRNSAAPRLRQLADVLEAHVCALVGGEVGRLLAQCGLAEVVERMRLYQQSSEREEGAVASDPALAITKLADALRSFFVLVSSPDALPEFQAVQVRRAGVGEPGCPTC